MALGDVEKSRTYPDPGRQGGSGFLDALARRYRVALTRFFEKRVPHLGTESEDLTQEVFARLARRGDGEQIENVEGYIFQTAANVLSDRARRRAVRHESAHVAFDELLHADADFSPERIFGGKAEVELVIAKIQQLPEPTRRIFILHRFENETQSEIARRLGISVSWVEKHIGRAVAYLIEETRRDS